MGAYALIHECGLQDFYALRDQSHSEISLVKSVRKQHVLNDLEAAGVPVETFSDGLCRVQLSVDGLHCAACSWLIEKMRGTVPGLKSARARMSDGTLDMVYDPQVTSPANVAERLGRLGYVLSPIDSHDDCESADRMLQREHWIGMATSFFLAANAMWIGISLYAGEAHLYSRQSTRIDRATGRRLEKCRPGHSRLFCSFAALQHHHHFFSNQWLDSSADRGFIHAAEWDYRPDDGVVGPHIQDRHPSKSAGCMMSVLYVALPLAILLGGSGLVACWYCIRTGQYDDLESPAVRMLIDEEPEQKIDSADAGCRATKFRNPADSLGFRA
jgi:cbb3-type cytochrome oxidase maturation protein